MNRSFKLLIYTQSSMVVYADIMENKLNIMISNIRVNVTLFEHVVQSSMSDEFQRL